MFDFERFQINPFAFLEGKRPSIEWVDSGHLYQDRWRSAALTSMYEKTTAGDVLRYPLRSVLGRRAAEWVARPGSLASFTLFSGHNTL